ncbi:MAG: hypothetical protein AAGK78_00360 [Planctomycetota bacterium]
MPATATQDESTALDGDAAPESKENTPVKREIILDPQEGLLGAPMGNPVAPPNGDPEPPVTLFDKVEAFVSRLSARDTFWNRIFSLLFLPLAFWSGIRMKTKGDAVAEDETNSFTAILPFKKFNKNWYNAMAGASLLANTEIAAGMYVFGEAGGDYTVVCKNLNYKFLRPCVGPAVFRAKPQEDIHALIAHGREFNLTLDMDIRQLGLKPGEREKRVGKAEITFHVTPKAKVKERKKKLAEREKQKKLLAKQNKDL